MREIHAEETSAGGVVWRQGLVLVLRNFRGEYIFPKGHIEAGETPPEAALREVAEESGLSATIISPLPDTTYSYQRVHGGTQEKRVIWFNMEAISDQIAVDGVEIRWGAFMPPFEAQRRLTHALDRQLLDKSTTVMQKR